MKAKIFLCLFGLLLIIVALGCYDFYPLVLFFGTCGVALLVWGAARKRSKVTLRATRRIRQPKGRYGLSPRRTVIRPSQTLYWHEQGWRRVNGTYVGRYLGKYHGEAIAHGGKYQFFVMNPPKGIKHHSHSCCFTYRRNGKFSVHFSRKPTNLGAGILAIENILREVEKC